MPNKSCSYCGRVHPKEFTCPKKPMRPSRYDKGSSDAGRYTRKFAEKSRDIKERSNWLCAVCLDQGVPTTEGLETHHIIKLSVDPDLLLDDSNLVCLCQYHHEIADRGKLDARYLMGLAEARDASKVPAGGVARR